MTADPADQAAAAERLRAAVHLPAGRLDEDRPMRSYPEVLMYRNEASPVTTAERISGLIEASGLTPQEFAQRAQLDQARLINALNGLMRFSSLDVALIAEFTETTVDWLITGKNPWGDLRISLCRMPPEA